MKSIFFVTKTGPLYDIVLPLIEEQKDKKNIVIISTSPEVDLFFKNHTDLKVINLKVNPNLITRKTKYKIVSNIVRSIIEYNKLFKNTTKSNVYFFGNSFSIVVFSYLKKLSKKNNVYHYFGAEYTKKSVEYPIEKGLRAYSMKWIAKWLLGVETTVRNNQGVPFWKLDEKFYKKNHIEVRSIKKKVDKKYKPKIDVIEGKEILITTQDLMVYNYVDDVNFVQVLDSLMDLLDESFPDSFVIKPHPREKTLYGKMKDCKNIVPAYIPSEFLMDHKWKIIIGMFSTSLLSASNLTNSMVISLVDLFKWNDEKHHQKWRAVMEKGNVIIPKDFNELKHLLVREK